jgi:hypothetical protein
VVALDDSHFDSIKQDDPIDASANARLTENTLVLIEKGHLADRISPHGIHWTDVDAGRSFTGAADIRDI